MIIEESEGYKNLRAAIESDEPSGWKIEERMKKLSFAVDRAKHYEEKTGIPAGEILTAWESRRDYWYMNYYQDAGQPKIDADSVRVFETKEELLVSLGKAGFRCPHCNGVTQNPYACDSGVMLPLADSGEVPKPCNWKVYGLFRSLGKGVHVFVKSELKGEEIFMPISWEESGELAAA
jgi:hypothetical protein